MSKFTKQEQFKYAMKFAERTGKMVEILCYDDNVVTKIFNFSYVFEYNQEHNKAVIEYKGNGGKYKIVDMIDFNEYDYCVLVFIS